MMLLCSLFLFPVATFAEGSGEQDAPATWEWWVPDHPEAIESILGVEIATVGPKLLSVDLHLPRDRSGDPQPLIAWVHGGGWHSGEGFQRAMNPLAMIERGYAVASITYRSSEEGKFPAQLEDCKLAIRWLRAHADRYNYDPERIGLWGHSAGSHLSALMGVTNGMAEFEGNAGWNDYSSAVQAVSVFCGPTDLPAFNAPENREKFQRARELAEKMLGATMDADPDLARRASPITYVSQDAPPFLVIHGEADEVVPYSQGMNFYRAIREAGGEATFHLVRGGGHIFTHAEIRPLVEEFFDRHLKCGAKEER